MAANEKTVKDNCPVCGYRDPETRVSIQLFARVAAPSLGYHDAANSHEQVRNRWIARGCPWTHQRIAPPSNWSPSQGACVSQPIARNPTALPELAVVVLLADLSEHCLHAGDERTVVIDYNDGEAYEVEFVDDEGYTNALLTLPAAGLRMTWSPH